MSSGKIFFETSAGVIRAYDHKAAQLELPTREEIMRQGHLLYKYLLKIEKMDGSIGDLHKKFGKFAHDPNESVER